MILKAAAAGAVTGVLAALIGDVASTVVLFGSAATMLAIGWRKVLAPLVRLSDVLAKLPEWMNGVDKRLDRGHEHFELMEERIERLEAPATIAAEKATAVAREPDVPSRDVA